MRVLRIVWLNLMVALMLTARVQAADGDHILVMRFDGPVTPVLLSYIERGIDQAERDGASALILQLDTPGGSTDITKAITQRIRSSSVPVIVYVAPAGAHAGSAGTFITLSAQAAAMAPGSSIGAASPVDQNGQNLESTIRSKLENILVADVQSMAARRGPQAVDFAVKAITEARAASADEALNLGVVDAVAPDLNALQNDLDGLQVEVGGQTETLHLAGLPRRAVDMNPIEVFLNAITNPTIATLLLSLGTLALLTEVTNPGAIVPGVVGAIALLLAFYALGQLSADLSGLLFIGLAFALFVLDVKAPTHGVLTAGGILSFILGSAILARTPYFPIPWVSLIGTGLGTGLLFAFIMGKAMQSRLQPTTTGFEGLIGAMADARTPLTPTGMVFVQGEYWNAKATEGSVDQGETVKVIGHDGFTLQVQRLTSAQREDKPA